MKAAIESRSILMAKPSWTSARAPRKSPRRKAARALTEISASPFRATRTTRNTMFPGQIAGMIGTSGTAIAITSSTARRAGATPTTTIRAARTLTHTATGAKSPTTAVYGFRPQTRNGLRTAMAVGFMSLTTAGPGFPMNRGAGRRITTAAGSFTVETGAGGQGRFTVDTIQSGRRHTSPSSDLVAEAGEVDLASASAAALGVLGGCRVARATGSSPGMARA